MGQITEYFAGELLVTAFNRDTYTPPYNRFEVALFTQVPTLNADVADLIEPVGNAYARATIPYNTASWGITNYREIASLIDVAFPAPTGFWGTIEGYAIITSHTVNTITKMIAGITRLTTPMRVTAGMPAPALAAGTMLFGLYD